MVEKEIEDARDLIREKKVPMPMIVDDKVNRFDTYSDEGMDLMTYIYNLCNDANEYNWRKIIEQIQNVTREY